MMSPLVSVVLPIYNVEAFLDRCISSVVQQTYLNLEIILVDDGSPDRCPQICDDWAQKDSRIKVVHKENAGLGMARNTGIEHATGQYISFVDSDDYLDPETIEDAVNHALKHSADVVLFGRKWINQHGEILKVGIPRPTKMFFSGKEVQECLLPDAIHGGSTDTQTPNLSLSACTAFFSMELIRRSRWRFISERENISEDTHSFIWLYQHITSAVVLEKAYYNYVQNTASLTQTFRPDRFPRIAASYKQTKELASLFDNSVLIEKRISELYLGFLIAAMKQIVACSESVSVKYRNVLEIVNHPATQTIVNACGAFDKTTKNIMAGAMRKHLTAACYMLLWLQVQKSRR